jgi:predicted N-acetyltransferase YhbS
MEKIDLKFRDAVPADIPDLMGLWRRSFPDKDSSHWQIVEERLRAGLKTERIVVRAAFDGRGVLAGAVQHLITHIRIGDSLIRNSHLGEVSVLPELQGAGLGSRLMTDSVRWLESSGAAQSAALGGLVRFYSRFGFTPAASPPALVIPFKNERGGVKEIHFKEIITAMSENEHDRIRDFDPEADKETCLRLQNPDCGGVFYDAGDYRFEILERAGAKEISRLACGKTGAPEAWLFVYGGGTVCNFGAGTGERGDAALAALLRRALTRSFESGHTELRVEGGELRRMAGLLRREEIAFTFASAFGGRGSRMVFVPSLKGLFEALKDGLNRRLRRAPVTWTGKVGIHMSDRNQSCVIAVKDSAVESVSDGSHPSCGIDISVTQSELMMRLLDHGAGLFSAPRVSPETSLAHDLSNILLNGPE